MAPPQDYHPRGNSRQGAVHCNGSLHFIGQGDGDIVTFNVSDKTFGVLKPPLELRHRSNFELTVIDGCLCAYIFKEWWNMDPDHPCDVWLLRDHGIADSRWEKLRCDDWGTIPRAHRARLSSSWIAPLHMCNDSGNHKRIMFGTGSCSVFSVDPSIGTPEILFSAEDSIIGECHSDQLLTVGLFEEVLARVRDIGECAVSSPSVRAWSEVLSRLPAHTVRRLNQVCRSWRAMIMSERFVEATSVQCKPRQSPQCDVLRCHAQWVCARGVFLRHTIRTTVDR
ncbi:hypothetical protein ACP4OV_010973 [Aristida adscensionis]